MTHPLRILGSDIAKRLLPVVGMDERGQIVGRHIVDRGRRPPERRIAQTAERNAARDADREHQPAGVSEGERQQRVRPAGVLLPRDVNWWDATAQRRAPALLKGVPINEPALQLPAAPEGEEIVGDYAALGRAAGDDTTLAELPGASPLDLIDPLSPAWPQVVAAFQALAPTS